ncbi:sensor histidine kinase [Kribbia dieselivorans]|uniref:sensor histidine kinase n=1 Tax=Kribbia dieselivorans TaxID=331526 RepID=UPI000839AAB4|nr:histidine kinase N-terminal domain-containing protein [Kribbia dieselivorans]
MSTLTDGLERADHLDEADREHLIKLTSDWQVLSDLSFADLVVWVRQDGHWRAAAHTRPMTGSMVFFNDLVGRPPSEALAELLDATAIDRQIHIGAPSQSGGTMIRTDTAPITRDGKVIGVLSRHTNLDRLRTPSNLESNYQQIASRLLDMIASGEWPTANSTTGRRGAPRVSDGIVRIDAEGTTAYISPNALSAVHRLGYDGEVMGQNFTEIITSLLRDGDAVDESLAVVTMGRAPWRADVSVGSATVALRAIPLTRGGRREGALILIRDVSELTRTEEELLSKDDTIREIHHRVKNNLQTVAALLRLQSRRLPEGPGQVALNEAVRRVGTIALVHETLSTGFDETVDFDEIARRSLRSVIEVATSEHRISSRLQGSFGRMRAEDATAVAMITSELVQNASEHGLADRDGTITITGERSDEDGQDILRVTIEDDGVGLPRGYRPSRVGLGTRIVTSLVSDLGGTIRWEDNQPSGTRVRFSARLRPLSRAGGR